MLGFIHGKNKLRERTRLGLWDVSTTIRTNTVTCTEKIRTDSERLLLRSSTTQNA